MRSDEELSRIFTSYAAVSIRREVARYFKAVRETANQQVLIDDWLIEQLLVEQHPLTFEQMPEDEYLRMEYYTVSTMLGDAIARLAERDKLLLYYKYVVRMTDVEIADVLGIAFQNVSKAKLNAIHKIKTFMENNLGGESHV